MPYDYSKLLGRIVEKYGSQVKFSEYFGLSAHSLSVKLNGQRGFKQLEITRACKLLDISVADIPIYFFTLKVH